MFKYSVFVDEISADLDVQIETLKSTGIEFLDLRSISRVNILDFTEQYAMEVANKLQQEGLHVASIGAPVGKEKISEPFEKVLRDFEKILTLNRYFKAKYIRIFSFYCDENDYEKNYSKVLSRIKTLTMLAKKYDVILLLENENGIFADEPKITRRLIEDIGSEHLRVVFDMGNYVFSEVDTVNAYKELVQYIEMFHVKDAIKEYNMYLPAGQGNAKVDELVCMMKKDRFQGFVSFEPHLGYYMGQDDNGKPINNIERTRNYYDKITQFSIAFHAFINLVKNKDN